MSRVSVLPDKYLGQCWGTVCCLCLTWTDWSNWWWSGEADSWSLPLHYTAHPGRGRELRADNHHLIGPKWSQLSIAVVIKQQLNAECVTFPLFSPDNLVTTHHPLWPGWCWPLTSFPVLYFSSFMNSVSQLQHSLCVHNMKWRAKL